MQLEEFVSHALKQVISGIVAAQKHASETGGEICPLHLPTRDKSGSVVSVNYRNDKEYLIEFDVAVTASDGTKTAGGIGIFVGPIGVGSKGESIAKAEQLSRVKFAVPIVYPYQKKE